MRRPILDERVERSGPEARRGVWSLRKPIRDENVERSAPQVESSDP